MLIPARTQATRAAPTGAVPSLAHCGPRRQGRLLDPRVRAETETRLHHDFARFRIHSPLALADGRDEPLTVERGYTPDWSLFLQPMSAPAVKEKCKEFPGGSTDCEINESTGIPTGKVKTRVDETNACTKPCVEKHEAVHVKQMAKLCAEVRDCYVQADKGKRPATDCFKMAIASSAKNECEAYAVSVPCVEQRLKSAPECKSTANQRYGAEKLESEKCFRDHYCAGT
jgi:hypothetical protein